MLLARRRAVDERSLEIAVVVAERTEARCEQGLDVIPGTLKLVVRIQVVEHDESVLTVEGAKVVRN
jgi:hypothetical protein